MQEITLVATPAANQKDSLGFKSVQLLNLNGTNPAGIMPGDMIELICQGGPPNLPLIGIMWPWATPGSLYLNAPNLDANGNMSVGPVTCVAPGGSGPFNGSGLLIAAGIDPGGEPNPFGFSTCFYGPPKPQTPVVPSFATFVQAVENSWNTRVAVVDYLDRSIWYEGAAYTSNSPFSLAPVVVNFPPQGPAVTQPVAQTLATLMGGMVVSITPDKGHYSAFYQDPGAQKNSLQTVYGIQAQVPLGPNGGMVTAVAYASDIVTAMFYGRTLGIEQQILNCFHQAAQ